MEKRIYIIGAGFAGQTIADDIKRKKIFGKVNAFIDDDKNKQFSGNGDVERGISATAYKSPVLFTGT